MDKKTRKLIHCLDKNARLPITSIAHQIGLSHEATRQRMHKAVGTYLNPVLYVNSAMTGRTLFKTLFKLRNYTPAVMQKITDFFLHSHKVTWLVEFEGPFQLGVGMRCKSIIEYNELIQEFYARYAVRIHRRQHSVNLRERILPRRYLIDTPNDPIAAGFAAVDPGAELSAQDAKLLALLSEDARMSAVRISNELGVSADTVARQIRRLEQEKIIRGYGVYLDTQYLGIQRYKILLYLSTHTVAEKKLLHEYLTAQKNTIQVIKSFGTWDYEVDIEVENADAYHAYINELLAHQAQTIRDYEVLELLHIHRLTNYPLQRQTFAVSED